MATVPQFPSGTLSRSALNTFVTETTTNIDNSNIAAGAGIVDTKLTIPLRVKMSNRQGGSATDWNTVGTSTQSVAGPVIIQAGAVTSGASETTSGSFRISTVTVTFPTAFTAKPLVFANMGTSTAWVRIDTITTTSVVLAAQSLSADVGTTASQTIYWTAIGM